MPQNRHELLCLYATFKQKRFLSKESNYIKDLSKESKHNFI